MELVHANDSGSARGSHRDLHANPGEGSIGESGFRALASVTELARVPWVLEVPGIDDSGPRREEIDHLRAIVRAVGRPGGEIGSGRGEGGSRPGEGGSRPGEGGSRGRAPH